MKLLIVSLFMIAGLSANAAEICSEVPDNINNGISADVSVNFDGSINLVNPQVFVKGKMMPVGHDQEYNSALGFCSFYGKKYAFDVNISEQDEEVAMLSGNGKFIGLSEYRRVLAVTCR